MRLAVRWLIVEAVLTVLLVGLFAPSASASVPLGGGAGIIVDGTYCTLTTIGHDNTGELVGFTSAHCGGPGAQVLAEGTDNNVGTVVAANGDLDYAVIKFDPATVNPVHDFAGFAINGIGPDPGFGQSICTQGGATGFGCGFAKYVGLRPGIDATDMAAWQPGDIGAPVTVDGQLVGMTRHGFTGLVGPPPRLATHTSFVLFSAIIADVDATGGPGAGFTPVPA